MIFSRCAFRTAISKGGKVQYFKSDDSQGLLQSIFVTERPLPNLISSGSHNNAHQRTKNVEEAVGQIGERGHAQHGALRHAARVPWNQYRCHRNRILSGAAEKPVFKTVLAVDLAKHVARKQYAHILVSYSGVKHQSCGYG